MKPRVLLIDDDGVFVQDIRLHLGDRFELEVLSDGNTAVEAIRGTLPDVVLLDIEFPGGPSGLEVLSAVRNELPRLPIIMVSRHDREDMGREAWRRGCFDYIEKSCSIDELAAQIGRAVEEGLLFQQYQNLREEIRKGAGRLVGESPEMRAIREEIDRVAGADCTVLLTGETGTGKDLIAREIHDRSGRRDNMFVNVGCDIPRELAESELFGHERGAFTGAAGRRRGLFALADRGTLFLNDIAKLPKEVQGKLLRAVEEGTIRPVGSGDYVPVDFRLIAATSRNLEAAVEDGEFLEDLYFRLKVIHIHVPPLRERLDDIPPLVAHFLDTMTGQMNRPRCRLSWQAMERLRGYHWPGNVRELRNTLENALVHWGGEVLGEELFLGLPGSRADRESFKERLNRLFGEIEKREILLMLRECKFNVAEAARRMGFTREGLRKKMKRLGITRPES